MVDVILLAGEGAKSVSSATHMQPSEKWLNIEEEEEGGEGISLQGAPGDGDGVSGAKGSEDPGAGIAIEVGNTGLDLLRYSQHAQDFQKSGMVDHVEGSTEVHIESVDVLPKELGILNGRNDHPELPGCAVEFPEPFLCL